MDTNNLWTRRAQNTSKLPSLSTGSNSNISHELPIRPGFTSVRSSHSNKNPFNSPAVASPTAGASSAFGLGSGAFGFAGSAKTPKTPGGALDFGGAAKTPALEKPNKMEQKRVEKTSGDQTKLTPEDCKKMPTKYTWVQWVRPPVQKQNGFVEYEKTLHSMVRFSNLNEFGIQFKRMKRPSSLPVVTDRHLFKDGIRPIWEDDDNKAGGKWELRLKKGIADRYWELTQFALVGNWFDDSEEINGAVVSVRNGEDILSIWVRGDSSKNVRIREQWKKHLECPPNTIIDWKSHDTSLQNRVTIDQQRKEKNHNQHSTNARNGESSTTSESKPAS